MKKFIIILFSSIIIMSPRMASAVVLNPGDVATGSYASSFATPFVSQYNLTIGAADPLTVGEKFSVYIDPINNHTFTHPFLSTVGIIGINPSWGQITQNGSVVITMLLGGFDLLGMTLNLCSDAICSDSSSSGFEQIPVTGFTVVSAVPLPAAFPLFASALAGMGLLGWRRKRKAAV